MSTVELIVAVLGGGGILGGIVALFKLRPEVTRVTVEAAEGAVIVQTAVITDLVNQVKRIHAELEDERRSCDERLAEQDEEIARLRTEVQSLRALFTKIDERQAMRRGRPSAEEREERA